MRDTRGANLVEYIIIVGLVALVAFGGFRAFGTSVDAKAKAQAACVQSLDCDNDAQGGVGQSRTEQIDQAVQKGDGDGGGGFWGWLGGQAKQFVTGGILGSFGGNQGWAGFSARMIIGVIPVVGQIADARDTIAGIIGVVKDPTSVVAWTDLGAAAIGWVPLFGDAAAQGIRGGKQLMTAIPWIQRAYSGGRQYGRGEPGQDPPADQQQPPSQ